MGFHSLLTQSLLKPVNIGIKLVLDLLKVLTISFLGEVLKLVDGSFELFVAMKVCEQVGHTLILFYKCLQLRDILLVEIDLPAHGLKVSTISLKFELATAIQSVDPLSFFFQPVFHVLHLPLVDFLHLSVLVFNDRGVLTLHP